ncbi:hypothetical protein KGG90_gp44 [Streptomyces phage Thestral]|uniref:Uncharacterized protein n=1 Tax=Streptomyces phage Thestral TaxID=2301715 RepID=A0A385E3F8_9CAUD|nr:hypothetical protein KGG90_gp44 [Streptomyces phage Thestral]AXQ65239.1 hypothetical protein SEA_THESTRAL_42 [Streptomyces phage Thestral]
MADETTETTEKAAPKKTTRKPDPVTQLLNEVRAELKNVGDWDVKPIAAGRSEQYDRRASAWGRHYAEHGTLDGLILSLGFEALAALNPAERRYSLVQLAAAALAAVEKLDGVK